MSEETKFVREKLPRAVGLLGGGVIGGGWAARFILNGVDVRLYGPSTSAVERVQKILSNARRAYRRLTQVPLPAEGALTAVSSIDDAVDGVEIVLESAPERLDLKQPVLAAASQAAAPGVLICSSTSGLRPSLLAAGVKHPERLLVAHPFNPVYLLPLVELCGGVSTTPISLDRAAEIFRALGMHPLIVRKEVNGFIANRLQEAMWREALWLVHDDVATVNEVDDAIRYSFGLRRAVIGPFSLGGGGPGMRQNMEKWQPELRSPWTKFTDIPEHDDAFLDKLAEQSDTRPDNWTVAELEVKRDDALVAVLRGLRSQGCGAGETIAGWEEKLRCRIPHVAADSDLPVDADVADPCDKQPL
ncbi:3-hydroxyacyl-CoA dehydrogenase NAD-binding domain-containing protein [Bradyrhizobium sp. CCBAU 21362]|uniref:3-hydroxyacyl-CoA dehydrogenase NAD-binding domain-containing protein n=1 Tax=Bradyrhizobium sp. CCBAU 21362 TaxID=1325082 RepID=UPI002306C5D5|nr:3-hydroxyacyl-CoA dehydrogenase NAD-binding domain-containing protein [Bradyrhizobium sp. CCBAU 21362]